MSNGSKAVFISHSTKDASTAQVVLQALEARGIPCWMAPRDIPAGEAWTGAILGGLKQCSVLVTVYSESAKTSDEVSREAQLAAGESQPFFLFRTDRAELSQALQYLLSTRQYIEIQSSRSPKSRHLESLAKQVEKALGEKGIRVRAPSKRTWKGRAIRVAAAAAVLYVTLIGGFLAIDGYLDHERAPLDAGRVALTGLLNPFSEWPGMPTVEASGSSAAATATAELSKEDALLRFMQSVYDSEEIRRRNHRFPKLFPLPDPEAGYDAQLRERYPWLFEQHVDDLQKLDEAVPKTAMLWQTRLEAVGSSPDAALLKRLADATASAQEVAALAALLAPK